MRSSHALSVILACSALAACGGDESSASPRSGEEAVGSSQSEIVNGVATDRLGNVGTIFFKFSADDTTWYWYGGTGTLVSDRVFLTAAHTFFQGLEQPGMVYGVTFVSELDRSDVPYQRVLPPGAKLYTGKAHTNPFYDPTYENPTTGLLSPNDVAVIVFDERVKDIEPARLAPIGFLDRAQPFAPKSRIGTEPRTT